MHKTFSLPSIGLEVEIGKHARQANGSVWMKAGKNRILATAVAGDAPKEFMGFFPLMVEYRERPSAAGKFPGGYIKREGRLSDNEVLTSRLIDRPIRPLFPQFYFNEVQIVSTVLSVDGSFPTSILSLIASSLALTVSDIPFLGPIGAVQVARKEGSFIFNPSFEDLKESDLDIVIAGTEFGICMVEGNCNDLTEAILGDLFDQAHAQIKEQVQWQKEIAADLGIKKDVDTPELQGEDFAPLISKVESSISLDDLHAIWGQSKEDIQSGMKALQEKVLAAFEEEIASGDTTKTVIKFLIDLHLKKHLPSLIGEKKKRFDGRDFDQIRPIMSEVGDLPCAHGSAFFQRGETQAITSVTLGTGQDVQKIEGLIEGDREKTFMIHYNFPPYSVGEARPMRSVGRREIGHGYLAENSFSYVLPSQEDFPYTVRSVVDITESNGSSSMAATCSTSLALMDAGVPLRKTIGGVAMGLIKDAQGGYHVFTDISGTEDAYGLMDFKVTGTTDGIMAFQMDIKDKMGIPRNVMLDALEQARVGRLSILESMKQGIEKPREQLADSVPRITTLKVPTDKIGVIIGPGGSMIKEIIAQTESQIDINDDGTVKIFAKDAASAQAAESKIRGLVKVVEVGETYQATVRRITNFGIFAEVIPGKDGLIHISTIAKSKQPYLEKLYRSGDKITVTVAGIDAQGKVRLTSSDLSKS